MTFDYCSLVIRQVSSHLNMLYVVCVYTAQCTCSTTYFYFVYSSIQLLCSAVVLFPSQNPYKLKEYSHSRFCTYILHGIRISIWEDLTDRPAIFTIAKLNNHPARGHMRAQYQLKPSTPTANKNLMSR